jgi:O-antigen/teichoic acid export membrane protein
MTTAGSSARSRLFTSTLSLGVRQGVVAALTGVGVLLLSRIMTPSQFAFYGWTMVVATVAGAIGDFGYGAALIQSGHARLLASRAIFEHLRLVLPLTVAVSLVIVVLPVSSQTKAASVLLAAGAALLGAQMLPTSVFEAEGRFAFIGAIEVIQRAVLIAGAVTLAAAYHSAWAAPAASAAAAAFGWGAALLTSHVELRPKRAAEASLNRDFARSWLLGRVANHLNYAVYPIVGTAFLTGRQLGLVLWALSVSAIAGMGSHAVARVIFPALVSDGSQLGAETHQRALLVLVAIGGPVVSAMMVFAGPLTGYVFGSVWLGAVTVLQIECVTTFLGLVLTPTAPAMYVFTPPGRAQRLMIAYTALTATLAVALITPVGLTAISIATAASSTTMLLVFHVVLRRAGHPGLAVLLPMTLILSAITAAGLVWAPGVHGILSVVLAAAWAIVVFGVLVALTRPPIPWDRARLARKRPLQCA